MLKTIILLIIGFLLLIKGADLLVDGSKNIAKKLHIPELVIGLTVVAIGGSMPELFISVEASLENASDLAIGNVIGSNLCNLLLILGLSALIKPVKFKEESIKVDIPICLLFTITFGILCNTSNTITRMEGLSLLVLCLAYLLYTILQVQEVHEETKEEKIPLKYRIESTIKNVLYIVVGIILLSVGGNLAAQNAKELALLIGLSERVVALTIVSIGTSLPELVTSIWASYKGDTDLAIGNVIGSNIFNMVLIMGLSATINSLSYNVTYNYQLILLIVGTILLSLFPFIPPKKKLSRWNGILLIGMYVAYIIVLLIVK